MRPGAGHTGPASPSGCTSGYTGADEGGDCFSNRADNCPAVTQLQNPGLPPEQNSNLPFAPDSDRDGIGDACDPDPAAPNGNAQVLCLKFALNVGGASGLVVGVLDPVPGPDCAAQAPVITPAPGTAIPSATPALTPTPTPTPHPAPAPSPTPTPTPGPPIELDISIDETGSVVPRDGVATVYGEIECGQPALVELEVRVVQRAGRANIAGTAETAVWCDGSAEWSAEVVGNGRFVGGWVDVTVHAEAQAGMSFGADDESARVQLRGGHGADLR